MGYATHTDVSAEFKDLTFGPSDKISQADVTSFCEQADAFIDGKICNRYEVPVGSSTSGFQVLKQIAIMLVSDRVKKIIEVKSPTPELNQQMAPSPTRQAMKMLDEIADGKLTLIGATLKGSHDGVSSNNVDNDICPVFKRDTDQW